MGCTVSSRVDSSNPYAVQEDIYWAASIGDAVNLERSLDLIHKNYVGIDDQQAIQWHVGIYQKDQAIHRAASRNYVDCVELLLLRGASVHARNKYGNTPLHRASAQGCVDAAAILLDNGADINSKNDDGETPLHRAVANGRDECVKLLLSRGADIEVKSNSDLTPEQLSALSNISPKNIRGSFFKSKMTSIFDEEKAKREQYAAVNDIVRSQSTIELGVDTSPSSPSSLSSNDSLRRSQSHNESGKILHR